MREHKVFTLQLSRAPLMVRVPSANPRNMMSCIVGFENVDHAIALSPLFMLNNPTLFLQKRKTCFKVKSPPKHIILPEPLEIEVNEWDVGDISMYCSTRNLGLFCVKKLDYDEKNEFFIFKGFHTDFQLPPGDDKDALQSLQREYLENLFTLEL